MDLDFGVKTWYLRPTFLIRVIYIVISVGIIISLYRTCDLLSDEVFKESVAKTPLVIATFLAIAMITSLLSFILFVFKIVPEYQFVTLLVTLISSVIYIVLLLIFVFMCCSESKCLLAQEKVSEYLNMNEESKEIQEFVKKNEIVLPATSSNEKIIEYCRERTTNLSKVIFGTSIFWLIITVLVYYSLLYTGQASKLVEQDDKEIEKRLTNDSCVEI